MQMKVSIFPFFNPYFLFFMIYFPRFRDFPLLPPVLNFSFLIKRLPSHLNNCVINDVETFLHCAINGSLLLVNNLEDHSEMKYINSIKAVKNSRNYSHHILIAST